MKHVLWITALGLTVGLVGCTENKQPQKAPTATSNTSGTHAGPPSHMAPKSDDKKPDATDEKPEAAAPGDEKPAEPADKPDGDKPEETKPE